MSKARPDLRRYLYPEIRGETIRVTDVSSRSKARLVWSAAHKFAYRRHWVFRTHWDGYTLTIRRAA